MGNKITYVDANMSCVDFNNVCDIMLFLPSNLAVYININVIDISYSMPYTCVTCDFSTTNKTNYNKHCQTYKHKRKVENGEIVEYDKIDRIDGKIMLMNAQDNIMDRRDKRYSNAVDNNRCIGCCMKFRNKDSYMSHIEKCKYYATRMRLDMTIVKNGMSETNSKTTDMALFIANNALKLASLRFDNAPPLQKIDNKKIERIMYSRNVPDPTEDVTYDRVDICDTIIAMNKDRQLAKYIGDGIVETYKTDDPKDQSVWTSDTSRLTYLIRTVIGDENAWTRDFKGVKLTSKVIGPILFAIHQQLLEHISDKDKQRSMGTDEYLDMAFNITDINRKISTGELHNEIIKYIAPMFSFDFDTQYIKTLMRT